MKKAFEAVMQKYEDTKKAIKKKWEARFNGKKNELSQDILKAGTPDELLAVAEKIKNEAEAMKVEQDAINQEDAKEDAVYESKRQTEVNRAHDEVFEGHEKYEEASEMNRAFDENRAAEEAALEKARIAEEEKQLAEKDAAKRAEILAKINGKDTKNSTVREKEDKILGTALSRAIHENERRKAKELGVEKTEFEIILDQARRFDELSEKDKEELHKKIAGLDSGRNKVKIGESTEPTQVHENVEILNQRTKEEAEEIMRSMTGLQGEWGHLPEDAPEVMAKLKKLMLQPGTKASEEVYKNDSEIDFAQVKETVDYFKQELADAERESANLDIRKEAEDIIRTKAGIKGEWGHLPEDAPEVIAKLKELLIKPGTILDNNKKWNEYWKNSNEIDFAQVKETVDYFKQELADAEKSAEI